MMVLKTRLFVPHRRGCDARRLAQQGEWDNAWAYPLTSLGLTSQQPWATFNRHPTTGRELRYSYVAWECNDPKCPALLGVRQLDLEQLLPKW